MILIKIEQIFSLRIHRLHHTHKLWELHNLKSALQHADSVHNRTIPYSLTSISLSFSSFPSLFLSSSFSLYLPFLFSTIILPSFVTVVREMCSIVKNRAPWNSFAAAWRLETEFFVDGILIGVKIAWRDLDGVRGTLLVIIIVNVRRARNKRMASNLQSIMERICWSNVVSVVENKWLSQI